MNNNQNNNQNNKTIKKNREEAKSSIMNLEKLKLEYSLQLNAYKQAIADYINYLQQNAQTPCNNYSADTTGISQACYTDIWQKSGCGTGNVNVNANSSWATSQTLNGLINDAWLWATETDYNHRMGCYGNPGNPYTIIGVGTDGNLYSRQGLDAPWQTVNDNSNGNIATVFTGNDGKLYGTINKNNNTIVYKNNWSDSDWSQSIPGTCCVLGGAMGQNGTIVGIGTDHTLYSKPNINGAWTQTASAGEWCGYVTIAPDGTLFVIGSDNNVDKKNSYQTLSSENWQGMGSGTVKAITIAPDGTFIGVGIDDQLYSKASYKDLSTSWQGPYNSENHSCCVTSITTVSNPNYNSSKFNTTTKPNFNVNNVPMTSVKGTAFLGTSPLSQSTLKTVGECEALCSTTAGCSGATYNETSTICSLRKGNGDIMTGSSADYSIVPKSLSLLKIVQNINDKLTQVNEKIQKISQPIETQFNAEAQQRSTSNTNLIDQYNNLVEERDKIQKMLNEYQTLDEQQVEGNIHISQNYYSFILLMFLAILVIFLLYKFSMPSAQPSTTFVQNGGELGTSAYYMVFGLFLLILLLTCYNKYKLL